MAEPRVSNKRLRDAQRVVHLIGGLMLSVCVYPVGGWFYSDLRRGAHAVRGFAHDSSDRHADVAATEPSQAVAR